LLDTSMYLGAKDCPTFIFHSAVMGCSGTFEKTVSTEMRHLQKIFQSSFRNFAILLY